LGSPRRRYAPLGWIIFLVAWSILPGPARADAVLAWNEQLLAIFQQSSGLLVDGPPEVAREMAIVDSAMFDAANAASGQPYRSMAYGGPAVGNASVDAAALSAGYTALIGIFSNDIWKGNPTNGSFTIGSATVAANTLPIGYGANATIQSAILDEIQSLYTTRLGTLGDGSAVTNGINLGVVAGNANLAANGYTIAGGSVVDSAYATDGSAAAILNGLQPNAPPGSGTVPGVYVPPSASGGRPEMFPGWGPTAAKSGVTPVGGLTPAAVLLLTSHSLAGPPAVGSSAYATALLQTECSGSSQPLASLPANVQSACAAGGFKQETAAQSAAALFWNDPGTTYQPPGHWLEITDAVMQSQGLHELQEARLSALVGVAEDDAGIAAWGVKYTDNLWRPATAITGCTGTAAWNANFTACDPSWSSLIVTPPHPDYVAGHPAFSGAGATVLANFFGTDNISFSSTSNSYCNGGGSTTWNATSMVAIVACTVGPTSSFAYSTGNGDPAWATASGCAAAGGSFTTGSFGTGGTSVSCNIGANTYTWYPTIYSTTSGCTDAGGTIGTEGALETCTLDGVTYVYNAGTTTGCNAIVNDGGANDSPLICPITETFASFSAASNGPFGAEYSRIAGGIHTPFAVSDALTLGNAIGEAVASANDIPEPATLSLLMGAAPMIFCLRRRREAYFV
jgi:hypothetical protein